MGGKERAGPGLLREELSEDTLNAQIKDRFDPVEEVVNVRKVKPGLIRPEETGRTSEDQAGPTLLLGKSLQSTAECQIVSLVDHHLPRSPVLVVNRSA